MITKESIIQKGYQGVISKNYLLILIFSALNALGHGGNEHDIKEVEENTKRQSRKSEMIEPNLAKKKYEQINLTYQHNVKEIFMNKCLSCHGSSNSDKPWYYVLPGVKQLINYDMKEAKKHMDMSNGFPFGGHGNPLDDLKALEKTIKSDDMPPLRYRLMHWNSKLTEDEIKIINNWLKNSKKSLSEKDVR